MGLAELLGDTADPDLAKEFILDIQSSAKLLVEQIREQRDLILAENNELKFSTKPLQSLVRYIISSSRTFCQPRSFPAPPDSN